MSDGVDPGSAGAHSNEAHSKEAHSKDAHSKALHAVDLHPEAGTAAAVIDWQAARARIPGGADGLRELTAMMIEECPRLLEAIRQGLAARDPSCVRLNAHTLGGSARHFAAREVSGAAFAIEALARQGDLGAVDAAVPALERSVAALLLALAEGEEGIEETL